MKYGIAVFICILVLLFAFTSCSDNNPTPGKHVKESPELTDSQNVHFTEGKKLFITNCQVCHGEGGKGDICPNLTDREWKYGNSDDELFMSISQGRPGGMPEWGKKLSEKQIRDLIEYIRSIRER